MKNVENFNCEALSTTKMQQIRGGTDASQSGFWQKVADVGGAVFTGLVEFGKSGGRNAGLTVK